MRFVPHIIDGERIESESSARFETIDPWTRTAHAEVALGSKTEADRAVTAARRAFDDGHWPRMGFAERGAILHRLADLIDAHSDELALDDTTDMGKPITDTRSKDVPRSAMNFRFFADHARLASAEVFPMDSGHHAYSTFSAAGVVVAIAPWNFPLMLESWKVAPALAWGNTVVLKPAEDTPCSATRLAELALEAGMPPGVLNVVHGYGPDSVGEALTLDSRVDRITFTGESNTGKVISRAAASNLVPVSLELGGKGANLVFADADIESAVAWSVKAIFSNAGQVCLAGSRLFVERSILTEFTERFCAAAAALVIGSPLDPSTELGPLASEEHYKKVRSYVEGAESEGGTIMAGGFGAGWTVEPTVIVGAPSDARVVTDEIFGPVVVITPFDTEEEAVTAANATPYGLSAMLFTQNLSRAHRVTAALRAGTVWTNCFFVRDLRAPFGGVGLSGVGREGGNFSREFFTEPKTAVMAITP